MINSVTRYKLIDDNYRALKNCSLFDNIDENDLPNLLNCLDPTFASYSKNEFILKSGEPTTNIGIVLSGGADIIKEDINGNNTIISRIFRSSLFAEAFVCAGTEKSPVSVLAANNTYILYLGYNNIVQPCNNLCGYHNQLIKNLLKVVANKNIQLNNKIQVISKKTIQEKVLSYLILEKENMKKDTFMISFNRQEMADYLCVDRSALSRELSKMKKQGLIDYSKRTFKII